MAEEALESWAKEQKNKYELCANFSKHGFRKINDLNYENSKTIF